MVSRRRAIVTLVLLFVLAGGFTALLPPATSSQSVVALLAARQLPQTLEEFLRLPKGARPSIFLMLADEAKATVMRQHWEELLGKPGWTDAQHALLVQLRDRATPDAWRTVREYVEAVGFEQYKALVLAEAYDQLPVSMQRSFALDKEVRAAFGARLGELYVMSQPQRFPGKLLGFRLSVRDSLDRMRAVEIQFMARLDRARAVQAFDLYCSGMPPVEEGCSGGEDWDCVNNEGGCKGFPFHLA